MATFSLCSVCQASLPLDALFCTECGAAVGPTTTTTTRMLAPQTSSDVIDISSPQATALVPTTQSPSAPSSSLLPDAARLQRYLTIGIASAFALVLLGVIAVTTVQALGTFGGLLIIIAVGAIISIIWISMYP